MPAEQIWNNWDDVLTSWDKPSQIKQLAAFIHIKNAGVIRDRPSETLRLLLFSLLCKAEFPLSGILSSSKRNIFKKKKKWRSQYMSFQIKFQLSGRPVLQHTGLTGINYLQQVLQEPDNRPSV